MERLPDLLESNAWVEIQVDGVVVGTRRAVNFIGATPGTDDGTDEVVSVELGGGDSLWTDDGTTLQPTDAPVYFRVEPEGSMFLQPQANGDVYLGDESGETRDFYYRAARAWTATVGEGLSGTGSAWLFMGGSSWTVTLDNGGTYTLNTEDGGDINLNASTAGSRITLTSEDRVTIRTVTSGNVVITSADNINLTVGSGDNLNIVGLPTSNPGGSGNVWNDAGTLKIT